MDIHNYKRRLEKTLENIGKSDISKENKETIIQFHDNCFSEGLSVCKTERYLYDLHKFTKLLNKELKVASKQDIQKVIAEIEKGEWSPHTKHSFKVMIKKVYRFISGIDEKGVYPENVRWIRTGVKNGHKKLPEDLLIEKEVELMIRNAIGVRDKALISFLWESGCRIGEIGNMKIKDVVFDEYGAKINLNGKTGSRRIRIVNSAPYLQEWINQHPRNEHNGYLWTSLKGNSITHNRFSDILKRTAKRSRIEKRIYPHLFRHSRATYLASYLTESQMKDYLGWTQSSKMCAVYIHLNGRDTDNAILKLSGIKVEENKQEQKLKAKQCLRCKTTNQSTNKFCNICGFVLDKDQADNLIKVELEKNKYNELLGEVLEDKDVLEMIAKKIKEIDLNSN